MQPKKNIVNLPVYQPGKPIEDVKREFGLTEVIKLASNENPFGSSERAKQAIIDETVNMSLYPDGASIELTTAIAEHFGINNNQIIFGTGSDEVILMICRAFLTPEDETITADETFSLYRHDASVENAKVIEVPLKDGKHDLDAMLEKVTDRTKIIWICNPNNPTGTIVTQTEMDAFMAKVPSNVLVVLDEAYCEYVEGSDYPDGINLLRQHQNLVLLRTFSKIYGLASLRIGYAMGSAEIIKYVNQVREPFNTSRFAQAAAKAALADQDFVAFCREENRQGIMYLTEQFNRLGLSYFPAYGNFVMVDVKRPSGDVFDGLLRRGIISRARWTHYPSYIRITVGTQSQNEKFITALEQVLAETATFGE